MNRGTRIRQNTRLTMDFLKKTKEVVQRILPTEKEECLKQITKILLDYNMMESNIPNNHDYWDLKNQYRIL